MSQEIEEYRALCLKWADVLCYATTAVGRHDLLNLKQCVAQSYGEINGQCKYTGQTLWEYACRIGFVEGVEYLLSLPTTDVNFFVRLAAFCAEGGRSIVAAALRAPRDAADKILDLFLAHRQLVVVDSAYHSDKSVLILAIIKEMPPTVLMKLLRLGAMKCSSGCTCGGRICTTYPFEAMCASRITMLCIFSDWSLKRKLPRDLWRALLRMLSKY